MYNPLRLALAWRSITKSSWCFYKKNHNFTRLWEISHIWSYILSLEHKTSILLTSLWAIIYSFTAHKMGYCHLFASCHFLFRSDPRSVQLKEWNINNILVYINVFSLILFQWESVIKSIYLVFPRKTPSGLSIGITLKTIDFRSSLAIPCLLVRNSMIPIFGEDKKTIYHDGNTID